MKERQKVMLISQSLLKALDLRTPARSSPAPLESSIWDHQAIDILNPLGLTRFEANLRPTVWTPGQIALDGTVADGETGKLTVFNAFRDTEPIKDVKISIGAQIFITNANGEIDLGPLFAAGEILQISHFQYQSVNLTIPADYVRHNLKVKINPLTAFV